MKKFDQFDFLMKAYYSRKYKLRSPASDYAITKAIRMLQANVERYKSHKRRSYNSGIAMSINHMKDTDTAYYNDELAASCGL